MALCSLFSPAHRAQAEAAQMQQKMLEQEQIRLKQMMEDQKRSHDEQCQLLREHMEKEKKKMEEETDRILQHKLQVMSAQPGVHTLGCRTMHKFGVAVDTHFSAKSSLEKATSDSPFTRNLVNDILTMSVAS